jgi:hypothetical protein
MPTVEIVLMSLLGLLMARPGGRGKIDDEPCPTCGGTGKVVEGVGGA